MNHFMMLLIFIKFYAFFVYFKLHQNRHFTNLMINLTFVAIYYCSKVQMKMMNISKQLKKYIKKKPKLNKLLGTYLTRTSGYKLIKDDMEVSFIKNNDIIIIDDPYDFMIYVNYEDDTNKNVICLDISEQAECLKADFKFILMEVIIKDMNFAITLVSDDYNYMMASNRLSKSFIKYFLKAHYSRFVINLDENELNNYTIKVLDHNMESLEFTSNDVLIINKSSYSVSTSYLKNE